MTQPSLANNHVPVKGKWADGQATRVATSWKGSEPLMSALICPSLISIGADPCSVPCLGRLLQPHFHVTPFFYEDRLQTWPDVFAKYAPHPLLSTSPE